MKRREDSRSNQEVLRLCRNINKRANNLEKLRPLVLQLHEVLIKASCGKQVVETGARPSSDNPFDKILVA